MGSKANIEQLKTDLVGRQFNWLTITDIFRSPFNGRVTAKCICKCGVVKDILLQLVTSGRYKSCGCYKRSSEYFNNLRQVYVDHPEKRVKMSETISRWQRDNPEVIASAVEKRKEWRDNNQDRVKEIYKLLSARYSNDASLRDKMSNSLKEYYMNNPQARTLLSDYKHKWSIDHKDIVSEIALKNIAIDADKRRSVDYTALLDVINPIYIEDLLSGRIRSSDTIETACPCCGMYDYHTLRNVYTLSSGMFKNGHPPMCNSCNTSYVTSAYEQEIADYISTFYSGECIRNSRDIISPSELDLYYPEKKIAVEFNGDYWHDENHKPIDYHYNKFLRCYNSGIILVSIFEGKWLNDADEIKMYLSDLFSSTHNNLSFSRDGYMNNNYPDCSMPAIGKFLEDSYLYDNRLAKVYTCGYSELVKH